VHLWLVSAGLALYGVCALASARCAYGVQRTRAIEQAARRRCGSDPVAWFEAHSRDTAAASAFVFGLAWPVTVPCYAAYRLGRFSILAHPPETAYDRARREERRRARIRQLEDDLGLPADIPLPLPSGPSRSCASARHDSRPAVRTVHEVSGRWRSTLSQRDLRRPHGRR